MAEACCSRSRMLSVTGRVKLFEVVEVVTEVEEVVVMVVVVSRR